MHCRLWEYFLHYSQSLCIAEMCAVVSTVLFRGLFQRHQAPWMFPLSCLSGSDLSTHSLFFKKHLFQRTSSIHSNSSQHIENPLISISEKPDTLYKQITILVKGHDKSVLDSYEYFAVLAANELGIHLHQVYEPPRTIERLTLLKSVHIFKKHRVQYEMRTHYRCIEMKYLTGCTADVYLEYIQRNIPEGVAMEIKKTTLEKLPEHLRKPVWESIPSLEEIAPTS
ncbi:small ribosomal subunit protein uS10m isoform X2 [Ambystoma mexicanum]|uniref:small ribosomal subunit protein uS10m isoform X2 n=1 Tax=Ambystoma mexicanum TaxID=8296 RepID=UPI0037E97E61